MSMTIGWVLLVKSADGTGQYVGPHGEVWTDPERLKEEADAWREDGYEPLVFEVRLVPASDLAADVVGPEEHSWAHLRAMHREETAGPPLDAREALERFGGRTGADHA